MSWNLCKYVGGVLVNPNGTVRSLNPSSLSVPYGPYSWTEAPAGTDGPYEKCSVNGTVVVYNPTGKEAVVFGFVSSVPNCDSGAISPTPLN